MSGTKHDFQPTEVGVEKTSPSSPTSTQSKPHLERLQRWNARVENLAGFEARGLERVPPEERQKPSALGLLQMLLLWFSANVTINNLATALTGPLVFGLGFNDSAWCAVIGVFLGSLSTSYMSTWGPVSGNRTMVVTRFFMGYYPAKLCTLLNIILMVGWGTIDAIIGGQVLSAVSGGTMTIAVGIVIVSVVVLIIATFGMKIFQLYERYVCLTSLLLLEIYADNHSASHGSHKSSRSSSSWDQQDLTSIPL